MAPIVPDNEPERAQFYDLNPPRRIGRGRHAVVFECHDPNGRKYAMKLFKRDSLRKVDKEIEALKHLSGGTNIIAFVDAVQGDQGSNIGVVLEFVDNTDFRSLFPRLNASDIRYYIHKLLKALQFTHSHGVMHRDIRPHNVVIDHQNKRLRLIGWSSFEFYQPDKQYSFCRTPFKPPEALIDTNDYGYGSDMWGLGSMLASMIFRKEPFFHGNSLSDQLVKVSRVLGTACLHEYCNKRQVTLEDLEIDELIDCPPRAWPSFVNADNEHLVTDEAINLVDKLLKADPEHRLTAEEALRHPYFEDLS